MLENLPVDLSSYTPSLSLQCFHKGRCVVNEHWGPEYKYYDLASLTKAIFTTTCFMKIHEQDPHVLNLDVGQILGWSNYLGVQVQDLLTHRSGLAWWKPFYKKHWSGDWRHRRQQLAQLLQMEKSKRQIKAVYSDLDYMVLGFILETLMGKNLLGCWHMLKKSMPANQLHFSINLKKSHAKNYAPTYSHQHRQQWVQGVVNDANAQAFGGISTHAGLFGRIEDVSLWLLEMRHSLCSTHGFLASSTVKKFMQRSMPKECGDWSLGFMLPSYDGSSGKYFSKKSVGHLGFTGTSFWWDSVKDVFIVILANRYVGQKEGEHFKLLRPKIHNLVMESLHI